MPERRARIPIEVLAADDIGMAGDALRGDNTVTRVLAMPFRKQRDYWRDASGKEVPAW